MADESNQGIPLGRALRWGIFGLLVLAAVALYFRDGSRVPPFAPDTAARTAATR